METRVLSRPAADPRSSCAARTRRSPRSPLTASCVSTPPARSAEALEVAEKPPLTYEEVRRVLHLLEPLLAERRIILVGGQAVAFWARYLAPQSLALTAAGALTSKDIDFEGSAQSVTRAAVLLAGRPKIATMDDHTLNTGLVMFTDSTGTPREIDFIDAPFGLGARDVRDTAVLLSLDAADGQPPVELWIMHPERCMESRVINAIELHRTAPLALRQLAASVVCAREWSCYLLDSDELSEERRVRAVLNLNERIFKRCMKDPRFRAVLHDHDVNPFDAILTDHPRLPERFREHRYAQMRTLLDERLRKDRRNRARAAARREKVAPKPAGR